MVSGKIAPPCSRLCPPSPPGRFEVVRRELERAGHSREVSVLSVNLTVPSTRLSSWIAVDWAVAIYALGVAVLALLCAGTISQWPLLVIGHGALLVALLLMPSRGAPWEYSRAEAPSWLGGTRRVGRLLRYAYPALLLTPFFEEVWLTVNATSPDRPYWFESYLYTADRWL